MNLFLTSTTMKRETIPVILSFTLLVLSLKAMEMKTMSALKMTKRVRSALFHLQCSLKLLTNLPNLEAGGETGEEIIINKTREEIEIGLGAMNAGESSSVY